jgi:hypothetical protein
MKDIPEDRYCCKYCYYCTCFEEDFHGKAICHNDIGELVDVDNGYCCEFDYDPYFERT